MPIDLVKRAWMDVWDAKATTRRYRTIIPALVYSSEYSLTWSARLWLVSGKETSNRWKASTSMAE